MPVQATIRAISTVTVVDMKRFHTRVTQTTLSKGIFTMLMARIATIMVKSLSHDPAVGLLNG